MHTTQNSLEHGARIYPPVNGSRSRILKNLDAQMTANRSGQTKTSLRTTAEKRDGPDCTEIPRVFDCGCHCRRIPGQKYDIRHTRLGTEYGVKRGDRMNQYSVQVTAKATRPVRR